MFKKLAVAAICFSCLNVVADQCPFGINIGQAGIRNIPQNIFTKQDPASHESVDGYREINLNPANFAINGSIPAQAKLYVNEAGIVEAIVLDYSVNNVKVLTDDLDKKYPKTYKRKTFYGSYDVEYINDNCLVRVIKSFGQGTRLMYGTINWFERYDLCCDQLNEIREKRIEYASEHKPKQKHMKKFKKKSKRHNPWKKLLKEFGMFDDSDEMFDKPKKKPHNMFCDDCFPLFEKMKHKFEAPKPLNHPEENCDVKIYRTSQSYSKNGDVEEWIYNDNGKITKVVRTPEGTRVIHPDGKEELSAPKLPRKINKDIPEDHPKLQMVEDIHL